MITSKKPTDWQDLQNELTQIFRPNRETYRNVKN